MKEANADFVAPKTKLFSLYPFWHDHRSYSYASLSHALFRKANGNEFLTFLSVYGLPGQWTLTFNSVIMLSIELWLAHFPFGRFILGLVPINQRSQSVHNLSTIAGSVCSPSHHFTSLRQFLSFSSVLFQMRAAVIHSWQGSEMLRGL